MERLKPKKSLINSLLTSLIYPKKKIPVTAIFYRHVHFSQVSPSTKKPRANSFDTPDLSCDWNRYCTPKTSFEVLAQTYKKKKNDSDPDVFKNPDDYFLCSLLIASIVDLEPKQKFVHDPIFNFPTRIGVPNNRAHSLILGNKSNIEDQKAKDEVSVRGQLARKCEWVIFDEDKLNKKIGK